MSKTSQPDLEAILSELDPDSLREMAQSVSEIEKQLTDDGPETDDELWMWVKLNLGIEIPRVPVCEGHQSPFEFLADCYFVRHPAILGMGNRGGGKTFMVALLHWLNSKFKPGIESATFGATEAQSLRCYAHLKNWIYNEEGDKRPEIKTSVMRETVWRSGSKVEVLAGTPEAVNGPHPQIVHGDEVELMREDTWNESRNMAVSKTIPDANGGDPTVYPSMEILTSTRKGLNGRMQRLIDGIQQALDAGKIPDYKLLIWCIFEIAQEKPDCQMAPKEEREARLKELGRDPCETCNCDKHMKGTWPDTGEDRLLNDVCRGRLFRSRGYLPFDDVVQKFKQNSIATWEAQQECAKPETEFNYLKGFDEDRHGVVGFDPDPLNGDIYQAVDWGGTNPHSVHWYQLLEVEIEAIDNLGNDIRLKEGTIVCFDEIYIAEIGAKKLGRMVKAKEAQYKLRHDDWHVAARFADPQGKMARLDWKDIGLNTHWNTTRDFDTHIEWLLRDYYEPHLLWVDVNNCPMFIKEAKSWQRDPKKPDKQLDEFNHAMSDLRYAVANIRVLTRKRTLGKSRPQSRGRHRSAHVVRDTRRTLDGGPVKIQGGQYDEWRARLGGPAFPNR